MASLVQANCETDFVARNEKFLDALETITRSMADAIKPDAAAQPLTPIDVQMEVGSGVMRSQGPHFKQSAADFIFCRHRPLLPTSSVKQRALKVQTADGTTVENLIGAVLSAVGEVGF